MNTGRRFFLSFIALYIFYFKLEKPEVILLIYKIVNLYYIYIGKCNVFFYIYVSNMLFCHGYFLGLTLLISYIALKINAVSRYFLIIGLRIAEVQDPIGIHLAIHAFLY